MMGSGSSCQAPRPEHKYGDENKFSYQGREESGGGGRSQCVRTGRDFKLHWDSAREPLRVLSRVSGWFRSRGEGS